MPHLVIYYTRNLDDETDIDRLCRSLADAMLEIKDDAGSPVFPEGGIRVLAYPAAYSAISDGGAAGRRAKTHQGAASGDPGDYAFIYLNLRIGKGRDEVIHQAIGVTLTKVVHEHFEPLFDARHIGITFQIDEGREVFDSKHSSIHPLFSK